MPWVGGVFDPEVFDPEVFDCGEWVDDTTAGLYKARGFREDDEFIMLVAQCFLEITQ